MELGELSKQFGFRSIIGVIWDARDPFPELAQQASQRNLDFEVFRASSKFDLACISSIRHYVAGQDVDIIHSHGYREDIYSLLAFTGKKKCATNHLWKKINFTLKLYAFADALCLSKFDLIVAVSRPINQEMARLPFLRHKRLVTIPNGIDIRRFYARSQTTLRQDLAIPQGTVLLGTLSSLTAEKGHRYLLEALSILTKDAAEFRLLIAGEGPERQRIGNLAKALRLTSQLTFLGTRTDTEQLLAGLDVFVLPSLSEGLPMALLEAMATGLAVVASDVGDVSQIVHHNETGFLVESGNPKALADAIRQLLNDPELRRRLGTAAAGFIRDHYSAQTMARRYCEQYEQLVGD